MRLAPLFLFAAAALFLRPAHGQAEQNTDDELKVYAVNVVKNTPFEKPFTGDGIYLGDGAVITAFHVIGRWGFLKNPHVLIAGQNLPATIVKAGSVDTIDLMLLSVPEQTLPVSLLLRRNPLCRQPPFVGEPVIDVTSKLTTRHQVVSPLFIAPQDRKRYSTLIDRPENSGSGVFDAEKRCLLGIVSLALTKFDYRTVAGQLVAKPSGEVGYFVPASQIAAFLPKEYRY